MGRSKQEAAKGSLRDEIPLKTGRRQGVDLVIYTKAKEVEKAVVLGRCNGLGEQSPGASAGNYNGDNLVHINGGHYHFGDLDPDRHSTYRAQVFIFGGGIEKSTTY